VKSRVDQRRDKVQSKRTYFQTIILPHITFPSLLKYSLTIFCKTATSDIFMKSALSQVISSNNFKASHINKFAEKLDGGNCCLDFSSGLVFARTHGHEASHDSFGPIKTLLRSLQSNQSALIDLLQSEGVRLFGENMFGVHSIDYSHVGSLFYVFAAYGAPLVPTLVLGGR
jgi:hypothetical protein